MIVGVYIAESAISHLPMAVTALSCTPVEPPSLYPQEVNLYWGRLVAVQSGGYGALLGVYRSKGILLVPSWNGKYDSAGWFRGIEIPPPEPPEHPPCWAQMWALMGAQTTEPKRQLQVYLPRKAKIQCQKRKNLSD